MSTSALLPVYTIGYGNRSFSEFVILLHHHHIHFLVDVRTYPTSKFHQDFSRDRLTRLLAEQGVKYVFMGNELGGRPQNEEYYTKDGRVDYHVLSQAPTFQQGLQRLITARERHLAFVIMCSEEKPQLCHRSKLIGKALQDVGIELAHIDETGEARTQDQVMHLIASHGHTRIEQTTLFDDQAQPLAPELTSRKRYRTPSRRRESNASEAKHIHDRDLWHQ